MFMLVLFIHFSVDGHLGCFSIMNNAATIICKFLCGPKFSFLLGEFLGAYCLDYMVAPCLSYLRNHSIFPQQFPTLAVLFYIPPAV